MCNIDEERNFKIDRILEEYDKRKTQKEIAEKFGMRIEHVSWVTQLNNYKHTRKITPENKRPGEKIMAFSHLEDYAFLDEYSIENFRK
jgi:hypothetical protein